METFYAEGVNNILVGFTYLVNIKGKFRGRVRLTKVNS